MSPDICIRTASPDDAPALANLHAASFADAWGAGSLATLLGRAQVIGLKAMVNDERAAGFILTQVIADEAEILTICVDPQARRLGIGRLLLDAACLQLSERGAMSLFLEVSEANQAAHDLYVKSGFVGVGRRKAYYRDGWQADGARDALVMKKQLAV